MAKKKAKAKPVQPIAIRKCLSCGQEFKPKGRTNRICPRKQCRVKRSRPGMYTEPIGHPNKPGPDYGVVFP